MFFFPHDPKAERGRADAWAMTRLSTPRLMPRYTKAKPPAVLTAEEHALIGERVTSSDSGRVPNGDGDNRDHRDGSGQCRDQSGQYGRQ